MSFANGSPTARHRPTTSAPASVNAMQKIQQLANNASPAAFSVTQTSPLEGAMMEPPVNYMIVAFNHEVDASLVNYTNLTVEQVVRERRMSRRRRADGADSGLHGSGRRQPQRDRHHAGRASAAWRLSGDRAGYRRRRAGRPECAGARQRLFLHVQCGCLAMIKRNSRLLLQCLAMALCFVALRAMPSHTWPFRRVSSAACVT